MSEQLNTCYIDVPRAYFAKVDKHAKYGAGNFVPAGAPRLSANSIAMLAFINARHAMYDDADRISYADFSSALGLCGGAVCHNLRSLKEQGFISQKAQSVYAIERTFSSREKVRVYSSLLNDMLDLGGVVKKLTKNAVMLLSEIIAHRLRGGNNPKPFIGGVRRVAKLLNVPLSTAHDVISELAATKAIYIKCVSEDTAGNSIVAPGFGNSKARRTGYELNGELLRKIKKIESALEERAEVRKAKSIFRAKAGRSRAPEPRDNKYALATSSTLSDEQKAARLERALKDDEHYQSIKRKYKELKARLFRAISAGDSAAELAIGEEFDAVREEIRAAMRAVAPPGELPEEPERYIK